MGERGIYRSIPRALLSSREFRALPERARWVFFVLKMNVGQAGIATWYPDELLARVSNEAGVSADDVADTLNLLEEHAWIEREDNLLWVKGQIIDDPHMRSANSRHRTSIQRHIAGLPRCGMVMRFCLEHADWIPIAEAQAMGLEWVFNGNQEVSRNRIRKTNTIPKADGAPTGVSTRPESQYAFMGELGTVWLEVYGGTIPAGSAKQLEALIKHHEVQEVARRFRIYCSATPAAFASVPRFVSTFGSWVKPATTDSDSDSRLLGVGGVPTTEELASAGIRLR